MKLFKPPHSVAEEQSSSLKISIYSYQQLNTFSQSSDVVGIVVLITLHATAPAYVFNSELQNLRFRHGDMMQNTRAPGGVWGRYTVSDNRISGGASSGYSLTQNGFETGGDKVFELGDSRLAVGAFFSYTDNSIKHARGGKSTIDSTGGGLYETGLIMTATTWTGLSNSTALVMSCAPG